MVNDLVKKVVAVVAVVMVIFLTSCITTRYKPVSIEEPGNIDLITNKFIPSILDWRYDPEKILVFQIGSYEAKNNPGAFFWNWHTNEIKPIPIPDIAIEHNIDAVMSTQKELIAYSNKNEIYLFDIKTNFIKKIASGNSMDFSPDTNQIVYWSGNNLKLFDQQSNNHKDVLIWNTDEPNETFLGGIIRWSPNGRNLITKVSLSSHSKEKSFITNRDLIVLIDTKTWEKTIIDEGSLFNSVSWSPNSKFITYIKDPIREKATLVIKDVFENCETGRKSIPNLGSTSNWSPDGSKILIEYWGDYYFVDVERIFGKKFNQLNCLE